MRFIKRFLLLILVVFLSINQNTTHGMATPLMYQVIKNFGDAALSKLPLSTLHSIARGTLSALGAKSIIEHLNKEQAAQLNHKTQARILILMTISLVKINEK